MIQSIGINIFIEKVEKKHKGIIFCQVSRVAITNHEISLDILTNQKWKGPMAIFRAIKTVIIVFMLFELSRVIGFTKRAQENKQANRIAEANDWTKK